ncbi:MAG: hypothetical protein PHS92_03760 [Candidatus Gracilibacteria bacterium]|nr:hypothetical protein [Candidatus Gracilibacteria bacterium]
MPNTINTYSGNDAREKTSEKVKTISHDYDYFIGCIEGNDKTKFVPENPDKQMRDEIAEYNFNSLFGKVELYRERISSETYSDYSDFIFLQNYIKKLFSVSYTNQPLLSAFETPEIKDKFFNLMKKYIYDNFPGFMMDLTKQFPILSDNEINSLLNNNPDIK